MFPGPLPRLSDRPSIPRTRVYILKARGALDVNKSFGSTYNAGIKTVFIVILEMIPGRETCEPNKKKKRRINKYERRKTEQQGRILLRTTAAVLVADPDKKKKGRRDV